MYISQSAYPQALNVCQENISNPLIVPFDVGIGATLPGRRQREKCRSGFWLPVDVRAALWLTHKPGFNSHKTFYVTSKHLALIPKYVQNLL